MNRLLLLLLAVALALPVSAQQTPNLDTFRPLDLPTPTEERAADGRPGDDYWQNAASYTIAATLDPTANRLNGTVTIHYTNNAPLELERLWLQLEQNVFAMGSRGASIQPADSRWRGSFPGGGYRIDGVTVTQDGTSYTPDFLIDDTRMHLPLTQPLAAEGGKVDVTLDYSFVIPQYGADRMGRYDAERGTVYEFAQWYPRAYVYDDVNGWNALPYYGQGEFLLPYGDYDLSLTVPHDMTVVSTGTLQNASEVLTDAQQARMQQATQTSETVHIIRPDEVGQASTHRASSGNVTWRYRAENVRDVAWAASAAFIWDAATTSRGTLAQSAYPHEGLGEGGEEGWEMSTQYVIAGLEHYSDKWLAYPYPVYVNVAGVVGGMEYPMLSFCGVDARGFALFGVTDHELGHTWFPMVVGSDERRHAWMDEGFNTFINYYSNLAYYGDRAQESRYVNRLNGQYMADNIAGLDTPIDTPPDLIARANLGLLAYRKPAYGLFLLREYILGAERFDMAFKAYIDRWAYKHPKPADFFRTIENVAGEDLDWFWRGWFYTTDTFDQSMALRPRATATTRRLPTFRTCCCPSRSRSRWPTARPSAAASP